jgi:hypothetical protein
MRIKKISYKKVVAKETPDGGDTLKVTITTSNVGRQEQTEREIGLIFSYN